jgi:diaminopimelate epimerase
MSRIEPIRFVKMQGIGNHFVVVDGRGQRERDWQSLAPQLCAHRFGVGADGLLVLTASNANDATMLMFNPDGSEDFCGNGLRCVARLVAGERDADLTLDTHAGPRKARVRFDSGGSCSITVDMGQPSFVPEDVPALVVDTIDYPLAVEGRDLRLTTLSTGTAHTIIFCDSLPEDEEFLRLSPCLELHPIFPERTSVMWTTVESRTRLRLRIWERGVGETWGCGSGACAAAAAAIRQGLVDSPVTVASRGGELTIAWVPGHDLEMTGPSEYVYSAEFDFHNGV